MERVGNRYYLQRPNGERIEVETETRGYIRIPSMPRDVYFIKNKPQSHTPVDSPDAKVDLDDKKVAA